MIGHSITPSYGNPSNQRFARRHGYPSLQNCPTFIRAALSSSAFSSTHKRHSSDGCIPRVHSSLLNVYFSNTYITLCNSCFDVDNRFEDRVDLLRDDGISEALKAVHP